MPDFLTPSEFLNAEGLADWRVVSDGATAFFPTPTYAASLHLLAAIGGLPALDTARPDIDIRPNGVTIRLLAVTPDNCGMTTGHLELARAISQAAHELGFRAEPALVQSVLIVPGAANIAEIMPFWKAVLGYEPRADSPEEDLVDPRYRSPAFWFENMEETRPGGLGAIHLAVWVPLELAQSRVDAALAAGGHIVRDEFAPAWWTLADSAGNEIDVSTVSGRA